MPMAGISLGSFLAGLSVTIWRECGGKPGTKTVPQERAPKEVISECCVYFIVDYLRSGICADATACVAKGLTELKYIGISKTISAEITAAFGPSDKRDMR